MAQEMNQYRDEVSVQYYIPMIFEGGMDKEECDMYYNQVAAQQNGGTTPFSEDTRRIVPRDNVDSSRIVTASILRKSRYPKSTESISRPRHVRRFSFSNNRATESDRSSTSSKLRRSTSMRKIVSPRVLFHEKVQVVLIDSIDDISPDIQRNLWMSCEELEICMQEAMQAKLEEDIENQKQQISDEYDDYKDGLAERRNSNTSVIDDDERLYEIPQKYSLMYNITPPMA